MPSQHLGKTLSLPPNKPFPVTAIPTLGKHQRSSGGRERGYRTASRNEEKTVWDFYEELIKAASEDCPQSNGIVSLYQQDPTQSNTPTQRTAPAPPATTPTTPTNKPPQCPHPPPPSPPPKKKKTGNSPPTPPPKQSSSPSPSPPPPSPRPPPQPQPAPTSSLPSSSSQRACTP